MVCKITFGEDGKPTMFMCKRGGTPKELTAERQKELDEILDKLENEDEQQKDKDNGKD